MMGEINGVLDKIEKNDGFGFVLLYIIIRCAIHVPALRRSFHQGAGSGCLEFHHLKMILKNNTPPIVLNQAMTSFRRCHPCETKMFMSNLRLVISITAFCYAFSKSSREKESTINAEINQVAKFGVITRLKSRNAYLYSLHDGEHYYIR